MSWMLLLLHYVRHLLEEYPILPLNLGVPILLHLRLLELLLQVIELVRLLDVQLRLHIYQLLLVDLALLLPPTTRQKLVTLWNRTVHYITNF